MKSGKVRKSMEGLGGKRGSFNMGRLFISSKPALEGWGRDQKKRAGGR